MNFDSQSGVPTSVAELKKIFGLDPLIDKLSEVSEENAWNPAVAPTKRALEALNDTFKKPGDEPEQNLNRAFYDVYEAIHRLSAELVNFIGPGKA